MSEPAVIADYAFSLLAPVKPSGRRIVISAGGTREPLDPVRFMGNRSTGHMGVALARAALHRGMDVTLVGAHLEVLPPTGVTFVPVSTATEMHQAMVSHQPGADVVVMTAAVADWIPAEVSGEKIRKEDVGDEWTLKLHRSPDILSDLVARKPASQKIVGFAAETHEDETVREKTAREKLLRKGVDVLVLNQVGVGLGFGEVETTVTLFFDASPQSLSLDGTKTSVAERLLEVLLDH
jgi:phosphopantothenoylcysteine decarboxylase/phosphopantothenate--cysteine ligase